MGLDITVYKIVKGVPGEDFDEKDFAEYNEYFRLINDDGDYENNFPEWTKQYEHTVVEDWYDWEKYKEETGIDINDCQWLGESYSEEGCFMDVWPNSCGKKPELEDFKLDNSQDGHNYDFDAYDKYRKEHTVKIDLEKVPTKKKEIKVLYRDECGYQRKGLNDKFYEDYKNGKIGYFVWSLKELKRYKKDYCDKPYFYQYPNGKKTDTRIYPKRAFQEHVIDNFVEGECVVTFDW